MAEWLRRLTRNQIPSGSVGSSPTDRDLFDFMVSELFAAQRLGIGSDCIIMLVYIPYRNGDKWVLLISADVIYGIFRMSLKSIDFHSVRLFARYIPMASGVSRNREKGGAMPKGAAPGQGRTLPRGRHVKVFFCTAGDSSLPRIICYIMG